jgi:hypothetical protein
MKKKILTLFILLLCPLHVYADSITISCPKEAFDGEEFTCEISGSTDSAISGVETNIVTNDGLLFVSFVHNAIWNGYGSNGKVSIYTADEIKNTFKIGTAKFKKSGSNPGLIELKDVAFYTADDNTAIDSVSVTVNMKETSVSNNGTVSSNTKEQPAVETPAATEDIYLEDIIIDNYYLAFDKDVYNYDLTIDNEDELAITPILSNALSTYKIEGNKNLKDGSVISIVVSKDDYEVTYTINIKKEAVTVEKKNVIDMKKILISIIVFLVIFNVLRMIMKKK